MSECMCGRKTVEEFTIGPGKDIKIYLCPYCAYKITMQTLLYNYSKEYMADIARAVKKIHAQRKQETLGGKK